MKEFTLKEVSKIKLQVLKRYLPAWARILGGRHNLLVYVDCFAGPGRYGSGEEGSPLIAIRKAYEVSRSPTYRGLKFQMIFVEKNQETAHLLQQRIRKRFPNFPENIRWYVLNENAHDFIPMLIEKLPEGIPAFFFVDPFGHPLTIPVMNEILSVPKREILLTLMWFALNRHLGNSQVEPAVTRMFGDDEWKTQPFLKKHGRERRDEFIQYFRSKIRAKFMIPFNIRYSPEDKIPGGHRRTKYVLMHFSNHPRAALLMKEVMWPLGDELGTFDYSGTHRGTLFSATPRVEELLKFLRENYSGSGRIMEFFELRAETYYLPFLPKHYRKALRVLEEKGEVRIIRVKSKKTGIHDQDLVHFIPRWPWRAGQRLSGRSGPGIR